jgi:hypothetical protein
MGSENGVIGLLSMNSASHRFPLRLHSRNHPRCLSSCPALATIGRVATLAIGSGGDKMNEIHGKHHFWSTCKAHLQISPVNDYERDVLGSGGGRTTARPGPLALGLSLPPGVQRLSMMVSKLRQRTNKSENNNRGASLDRAVRSDAGRWHFETTAYSHPLGRMARGPLCVSVAGLNFASVVDVASA